MDRIKRRSGMYEVSHHMNAEVKKEKMRERG
jgi:hypothetical protein